MIPALPIWSDQMSLQGLPDFFQPLPAAGYSIYYPYENAGNFFAAPIGLEIANHPDGSPDFGLELVRSDSPRLTPYGVLDFRLQPCYDLAAALEQVRSHHPQREVEPLLFTGGFLRLLPGDSSTDIPSDLKEPLPLAWNGLGNVRFRLKVSTTTATVIKEALQGNYLPLSARAEMEVAGVAPRWPMQIRFTPNQLLIALLGTGDRSHAIARPDLLSFFRQDPSQLPLEIIGQAPDPDSLAEALVDWVRSCWGMPVPAPQPDGKSYLRLTVALGTEAEPIVWDFSQPRQTYRPLVLDLNPLEAVSESVSRYGAEALIHYTALPSLSTGMVPITILANLPARRPAVEAIGVTLTAPPYLPYRPQAAIATSEFTPPDDQATVLLRLSPVEPPRYLATPYVLIRDSLGVRKFKGVEKPGSSNTFYLGPGDFPVTFITIEAYAELLDLATLQGICRWQEAGVPVEQPFELNLANPQVALALPPLREGATLDITAQSLGSSQTLHLGPMPAKSMKLGLHSFREYGSQRVQIQCQFSAGVPLLALDLLPEGDQESAENITVLSFTPAQAAKTWMYLVRSPFQAGYRYRLHPQGNSPLCDWSFIQSPFVPLTVAAAAPLPVPQP
jgi:hypothetical protein